MVLAPKQQTVSEVPVGLSPSVNPNQRLGIHYFPDTHHYRIRDLENWLPELKRMGMGWLTLLAPTGRAIPEYFIRGLLDNEIQPILHFQLPTHDPIPPEALRLLYRSYARWGVTWVALFDRPNNRLNWDASDWAQVDLVERFLDLFVPHAEIAVDEGLTPIFPPLQPGGDYWDLSFLQSALSGLARRGRSRLLDRLALSAYAWIGDKPLAWGKGGPDRWPKSHPYHTPEGSEDQLGFRIFDWYLAIARREIGKYPPIFLLRTGILSEDGNEGPVSLDLQLHAELNLAAGRLFTPTVEDSSAEIPAEKEIPDQVLACCFWFLAAGESCAFKSQAWFTHEGEKLPVVQGFYRLGAQAFIAQPEQPISENGGLSENASAISEPNLEPMGTEASGPSPEPARPARPKSSKPLLHYVLLPLYAWGAADWDLEALQPIIQETHPTVGFSLAEARLAARVTVVGGEGAISKDALNMLRENGCVVERVREDGTLVAS